MSRIITGELTMERARDALNGELANIVYSDPPWGIGNLKYWRTHNHEKTNVNWDDFISVFCDVVNVSISPHVFIEMGIRWVDQLSYEMGKRGIKETQRWTCYYGSKKHPNVLWHSGDEIDFEYRNGSDKMTMDVLSQVATKDALVFDPCCGKGMTARCALKLGMRFCGVELNEKRASIAKQWISKFEAGAK